MQYVEGRSSKNEHYYDLFPCNWLSRWCHQHCGEYYQRLELENLINVILHYRPVRLSYLCIPCTGVRQVFGYIKILRREPWSSGDGSRQMFKKFWVWCLHWIQDGFFFIIICCKIQLLLENTKNEQKEAGDESTLC